jgi:hypothetical protein
MLKPHPSSRPVGPKLTAKTQSSPSPRATGSGKGVRYTTPLCEGRNTTDSPRGYAQASLLKPAPVTAWPPFAPGALAGGARGGGVEGATARRAVWLLSSLAVLPPARGCWLLPVVWASEPARPPAGSYNSTGRLSQPKDHNFSPPLLSPLLCALCASVFPFLPSFPFSPVSLPPPFPSLPRFPHSHPANRLEHNPTLESPGTVPEILRSP